VLAVVLAAVVVTGLGYGVDAATGETRTVRGPGLVTVEIGIEHSRFDVDRIDVHEGTLVRFVVRNDDPIPHELVVGGDDVHARHERGTERVHPPVPGEVSLFPNETGETFYRFDDAGSFEFMCHLPGHLAYGMRGTVVVTD
jgi:uncharacterized cupredoxin-like copper-binding protein